MRQKETERRRLRGKEHMRLGSELTPTCNYTCPWRQDHAGHRYGFVVCE